MEYMVVVLGSLLVGYIFYKVNKADRRPMTKSKTTVSKPKDRRILTEADM